MPQLILPGNPVAIGIETSLIMASVGWLINEQFSTGSIALVGVSNMLWNMYIVDRNKKMYKGIYSPIAPSEMNEDVGVSI